MYNSFIPQEKDRTITKIYGKHVIENLSLLFLVTACEHVDTQDTLARENVSTQGTLAREHVSTQNTLAR